MGGFDEARYVVYRSWNPLVSMVLPSTILLNAFAALKAYSNDE